MKSIRLAPISILFRLGFSLVQDASEQINFCDVPCGVDQHPACECPTPYAFQEGDSCRGYENARLAPLNAGHKRSIVDSQNAVRDRAANLDALAEAYALLYDDDLAYVSTCALMYCSITFACLSTPSFPHAWELTYAYKDEDLSTGKIVKAAIDEWIANETSPNYLQVVAPFTRRVGCGVLLWGEENAMVSCAYAPPGLGVETAALAAYERRRFECKRRHEKFKRLCLDDTYDEAVYDHWVIFDRQKEMLRDGFMGGNGLVSVVEVRLILVVVWIVFLSV